MEENNFFTIPFFHLLQKIKNEVKRNQHYSKVGICMAKGDPRKARKGRNGLTKKYLKTLKERKRKQEEIRDE